MLPALTRRSMTKSMFTRAAQAGYRETAPSAPEEQRVPTAVGDRSDAPRYALARARQRPSMVQGCEGLPPVARQYRSRKPKAAQRPRNSRARELRRPQLTPPAPL